MNSSVHPHHRRHLRPAVRRVLTVTVVACIAVGGASFVLHSRSAVPAASATSTSSASAASEAESSLLTARQAQAILDMRLKALQGLDREKLQTEYKELEEKIAYFLRILSDEGLVKSILKEELTAIADKFGDDRKTEIQDVEDELDIEDLIEEEQCVFTLTQAGYIKRTPASEYTAQSKGRSEERRVGQECRSRWSPYH